MAIENQVKCPQCKGKGTIEAWENDAFPVSSTAIGGRTVTRECPACYGEGQVIETIDYRPLLSAKAVDMVKVREKLWDKMPNSRAPYVEAFRKNGYVYATRGEEG